ncbi:MAG: class I SAM-dependent methyltransferase [Deltaproteobacteria bacterium]|nr:class I SAM-dependent methyltransferase [Deltaproteobacteria bacterium]
MKKNDPCLLCKSSRFRLIHQRDKWMYVMCRDCGLVSLDPHPSEAELINSYDSYLPEDPVEIRKWACMMRPIVVKSAGLIESESSEGPGRLLDIGSGYGFFLEEMKSRGWEVEGVELSDAGRKYTQGRINVPVHLQPLESLSLPQGRFDVVTLFYVIEHLPDPLSTIREVYRILRPGGIVLVRWPHSTPIVRLLGPLSKKLDLYHTPYHLYDFSPRTIRTLLTSAFFGQIRTAVGGHTLPDAGLNRWTSIITGVIGEIFFRVSGGRILIPGVSKTTTARKPARNTKRLGKRERF